MLLDRIEKLRVKMGLTKAEVYDLVKVSQPMISMIRRGERQPSVKTLRRLEEAEIAAGIKPANIFQPLEHRLDKTSNECVLKESPAFYGSDRQSILIKINQIEKIIDEIRKQLGG